MIQQGRNGRAVGQLKFLAINAKIHGCILPVFSPMRNIPPQQRGIKEELIGHFQPADGSESPQQIQYNNKQRRG